MTGPRFPTADALDITASLVGRSPDRGNLNRTLRAVPGLHRTEERVAARSTGRPAAVWEWQDQIGLTGDGQDPPAAAG